MGLNTGAHHLTQLRADRRGRRGGEGRGVKSIKQTFIFNKYMLFYCESPLAWDECVLWRAEATRWLEAVQATGFADEHPPPQTKPPPHPSPPLPLLILPSEDDSASAMFAPKCWKSCCCCCCCYTQTVWASFSSLCQLLASRCGNDRRRRPFLCRFVQNGQKCMRRKSQGRKD